MQRILTKTHENAEIEEEKLILSIFVAGISFLNLNQKKNLIKNLDSPHSLALLSIEEIFKFAQCDFKRRAVWNGAEGLRLAKAAAYQCKRLGIKILLHDDEAYPELLRQIADPPYLLFVRGDEKLLEQRCVSVVGTRRLSHAGRFAARKFAYEAVLDGCNVVSGLAVGADSYAHLGALDAYYDWLDKNAAENVPDTELLPGRTIAVLPSSIDNIVPYTNKKLAASVLQSGGCIISEYAPGVPTEKWHFVSRNRIVAGLSPATVVIEAPAGSGALITADFALEEGRDVFFHEAAFGVFATRISQVVKQDLEKSYAAGRVSKFKMENTPERFLNNGAPVIKDYRDFCAALEEMPGLRSMVPLQGELFT